MEAREGPDGNPAIKHFNTIILILEILYIKV
jgi:hypothetical protein